MPIDPDFQKNRDKIGKKEGVDVWGPLDPPETLGIRGTYVAVDWDLCTGCGVCVKVCPLEVFDWGEASDHPVLEGKAFPAREVDCVQCQKCEVMCPVQAIRVGYQPAKWGWLVWLAFPLIIVQLFGGIIYGVWLGPSLGLRAVFYAGWAFLVLGFLFFLSSLRSFREQGEPAEGRNIMYTTVLVESGTYSVVRHPQYLGMLLMLCAAFMISQHWLFAVIAALLVVSMFTKWIHDEERHLLAKFGDDYRRYMERVPRLNPVAGLIRLFIEGGG